MEKSNTRILIFERDRDFAAVIEKILKDEGYEIETLDCHSVLIAQSCFLVRTQMPACPALGLLIVRDRGR